MGEVVLKLNCIYLNQNFGWEHAEEKIMLKTKEGEGTDAGNRMGLLLPTFREAEKKEIRDAYIFVPRISRTYSRLAWDNSIQRVNFF